MFDKPLKVYTINDILSKLENCIEYSLPFSHIRFGDGGIKFLHSILYNDDKQLKIIIKKEGLPKNKFLEIFELWGYYSRRADFIDTPEVYFNTEFWPRMRTPKKVITEKTEERLLMWDSLYHRSEIDNDNYCNPESNYLMLIRDDGFMNILDSMKNRKICIITAKPKVEKVLKENGYDVHIVPIVGHYEQQYKKSFHSVMENIKENAPKYDFWLVAAGELGRIYSGAIKEFGGRTVDIGFVIEFWMGEDFHPRLNKYLSRSLKNPLEIKLTKEGYKFRRFI